MACPLTEPGVSIAHAVFPLSGIVSAVTTMADGASVEVGIIGREGFVGLPLVLGAPTGGQEAFVQVGDGALRIAAAAFTAALQADPALNALLLRYALATLNATAQFAACNRLHPLIERCARWLLMAHDRVAGDEIALTQEYLGQMLGVRRSSVTLAASTLAEAGFISHHRGQIVVCNRLGLEAAACECYRAATTEFERLLGYASHKRADRQPSA